MEKLTEKECTDIINRIVDKINHDRFGTPLETTYTQEEYEAAECFLKDNAIKISKNILDALFLRHCKEAEVMLAKKIRLAPIPFYLNMVSGIREKIKNQKS